MASGTATGPRVLVLCDDDLLGDVIALCLGDCRLERRALSAAGRVLDCAGRVLTGGYDLIVLAAGASRVEPLVALARVSLLGSLLGCVGVTPLLVISRHAFEPDAESGIYHLPYPFDAAALRRQVERLAPGAIQP